jgi:hypothetical protein
VEVWVSFLSSEYMIAAEALMGWRGQKMADTFPTGSSYGSGMMVGLSSSFFLWGTIMDIITHKPDGMD